MNRVDVLQEGILALKIDLSASAIHQLLAYVELLVKWNATYNLTAIRNGDDMVVQHLLDSLAIVPFLGGVTSLADIGSGAGLPGIPVAIACPDMHVTLIDSVKKKSAFQQQAKMDLGLANIRVYAGRIEDFSQASAFDAVTARAFSSLPLLIKGGAPLLRAGGRIFAMKGVLPLDELSAMPADWHLASSPKLHVPQLNAERHLLILERN